MRNRTMLRSMAGMAAVAALVVASTGAVAHESKDPEPGDEVLDARAGSLADAEVLATQHRWDVKATLGYLQESRRFAVVAASLAERFVKTYASAEYAEEPGGVSLVRFVGEPPRDALALVAESGLAVRVAGGARYSEQALQDRAGRVHEHLLGAGFAQVATATTATDRIQASVFGKGVAKLPRELAAGVEVTVSEKPIAVDEHTRGGARLLDDGAFECTSGFTVVNGSGTTGVATAAHCDGLDQYQQPSDGLVYGMGHQAQHYGFWGDVEWKVTEHVEPAEYYARAAELREVNSVSGLLPVNTPSCVYGRSSNNRACDQVYSNFVIATFSGPAHWFLMAMDDDNTIGGDSGGPWSFGTEADGIHKGDLSLGGGTRNVWTRASLMPISLGVSVRTQ